MCLLASKGTAGMGYIDTHAGKTHKVKNKEKKSRNKYVQYDHKLNICIKWLEGKIVWIIFIVYKEHRQLLKTIENFKYRYTAAFESSMSPNTSWEHTQQ